MKKNKVMAVSTATIQTQTENDTDPHDIEDSTKRVKVPKDEYQTT